METIHAPVTDLERDASLALLEETHDGLAAALRGLSDRQWRFQPAPGVWSIAQNVEHVVVVEESIQTRVFAALPAGPPPERDSKTADADALKMLGNRSTRLQAPARFADPAGAWDIAEAIRRLGEARRKSIVIARSPLGFRDHTVNHPVFGPLDGYQWILTIAMHSARHTAQIDEVKQTSGYPRSLVG